MSPAFLDANIPIYAAGRDHPLKQPCAQILVLAAQYPQAFLTDAEVLQEILHRYLSVRLWEQGRQVLRDFVDLMGNRVQAVMARDVEYAARLADEVAGLSARDFVHAAVIARLGVRQIITADRGFDRLSAVQRLDPAAVNLWRNRVLE
jgi:predicted nucleic acid-binding protein